MSKRVSKRTFPKGHEYAKQQWGPVPTADHQLLGDYTTQAGEELSVRYLAEGPTGNPEFELQYGGPDGYKITVLDEATALAYLVEAGAAELV